MRGPWSGEVFENKLSEADRGEGVLPVIPYRTEFDADAERVAALVRARRGGRLLNLDRILLHNPSVTEGWGALMGVIRRGDRISAFHRELAITAVAVLNRAEYEAHAHLRYLQEAGASAAQIAALGDMDAAARDEVLFDPAERAVLAFAIESTRNVEISSQTMAAVRVYFPAAEEILELTMIVASYNMVSRLLVAMGVEIEGKEAPAAG